MTYILIFELVPETLMVFKFENPDKDLTKLLLDCHGVYINSDDEISEDVRAFLCDLPKVNLIYDNTEHDSNISKLKLSESVQIIIAGFML